ncbi:MAG TPA: choice-of-anchor Q domain-containing protein [Solirubrobacteraceae bacterium]|jgi:hypothetical protein|nr:choice-of-anchor Q domain-containing protein [Solirubrobacteraceae bacterium]
MNNFFISLGRVARLRRRWVGRTAGLVLLAAAPAATAAPIAVTSTGDGATPACPSADRCTLRGALSVAGPGDTVDVPAGTYVLTQGELKLCPGVDLDGAGARTTIVRPATAAPSRVVEVLPLGPPCSGQQTASSIDGLTITGGGPTDFDPKGGGVLVDPDASVAIADTAITANRAGGPKSDGSELGGGNGGGIDVESDGSLNLARSTVSGNIAGDPAASTSTDGAGAGIYAAGTVDVSDSTIAGNRSDYRGGGIFVVPGAAVSLESSTLDANAAGADWSGGNLYLDDGSGGSGAGGATTTQSPLGGLLGATTQPIDPSDDGEARVSVENAIIADGVAGLLPDCATGDPQATDIRSLGHNLSTGNTCDLVADGDIQATNPQLGPLRDNGGPTDTLAPAAGSPAVDAGLDAACPATDQRGAARPAGAHCDIGAVEFGATAASTPPAATARLSGLRLAPRSFRPAARGASILTGPHAGGAGAPGSVVSFRDSQAGSITFTVTRDKPGVRTGGACRPAPRKPATGATGCVRQVVVGSFRQAVTGGAGRLRFSGRLRGRALSGPYVLRATPHDGAGTAGRSSTSSFTVT